jgi:hypothetical protein
MEVMTVFYAKIQWCRRRIAMYGELLEYVFLKIPCRVKGA